MPLTFAANFHPSIPPLMAAALVGRRRPRNAYARRDWFRVSQRLAGGMTPAQVARAEGAGEAAVAALLAQDGFKELVAACEARLAEPPERHRAYLVRLARLALENALTLDWDAGVALFVLEEDAKGRDPAVTLAEGVVAAGRRAARPAATAAPVRKHPAPAAAAAAPRPYDPLAGLMHRGAANLRRAVVEEHAARHAARTAVAAETPPSTSGTDRTMAAAREALALKAGAIPPAAPLARLARQLADGAAPLAFAAAVAPVEPRHPAVAGLPRRPRAP